MTELKKNRILDHLERAVAAGEIKTARAWARELGVSAKYLREVAYGTGAARAVRRYKLGAREAALVTVDTSKVRDVRHLSPRLCLMAAFCREAGFAVGERVIVRAEPGRIVILSREAVER